MPHSNHPSSSSPSALPSHTKTQPSTTAVTTATAKPYHLVPVPSSFIAAQPPPTATPNDEPKPSVLWIGCSDSLITETDVLSLPREQIFVLRNMGNVVSDGDLSSASAVEWAVGLLMVKHIIICGHYGCTIHKPHTEKEMDAWDRRVVGKEDREKKIEEVSVLAEVEWLKKQEGVRKAIEERGMEVFGFVFDKGMEGREGGKCVRIVEGEGR